MSRSSQIRLLLRLAVAFAFLYPPINALSNPETWIGYFPHAMRGIVPDLVLLHSFGLLEVLLALWILSGKKIFLPSVIAALILIAIVIFDFNQFEVVFRDVSIALAAMALAIASRTRD